MAPSIKTIRNHLRLFDIPKEFLHLIAYRDPNQVLKISYSSSNQKFQIRTCEPQIFEKPPGRIHCTTLNLSNGQDLGPNWRPSGRFQPSNLRKKNGLDFWDSNFETGENFKEDDGEWLNISKHFQILSCVSHF